MVRKKSRSKSLFDAVKYLETAGVKRKIAQYRKSEIIFSQGDTCRRSVSAGRSDQDQRHVFSRKGCRHRPAASR
jgi:hypothetical protein